METQEAAEELVDNEVREVGDEPTDTLFGKVAGKFLKFADTFEADDSVVFEEGPYSDSVLESMTKEQLGELYAKLAGVPSKYFKVKAVALESIDYQVKKLPLYDPNPAPKAAAPAEGKSSAAPKARSLKIEVYEVLQPEGSEEILKKLAPQAREVVSIMLDLAAARGTTKLEGADLANFMSEPETAKRLNTRQDPARILKYYKSKLVELGLLAVS